LTDEESLYITDITNQWHQESWTEDERALLALEYMLQNGWTEKKALNHVKLPTDSNAPILGAMLYRWHKQSPTDRRLIESHESGHGGHGGRPVVLKTLGERIKYFGEESVRKFPIERWVFLNSLEARTALGLLRSRTNSGKRETYAANFNRKEWTLTGDCTSRWKQFLEIIKEVRNVNATRQSEVSGPTDDRIFMNYVHKFSTVSDAGLSAIKKEITKTECEMAKKLSGRFYRTFS